MRGAMGANRRALPPYGPQAAADDFVVEWQLLPPPAYAGSPAVSEAGIKLHPRRRKRSPPPGFILDHPTKPRCLFPHHERPQPPPPTPPPPPHTPAAIP